MDHDYISIQNGDRFTVEKDPDGYWAVKVQNTAWVEEPRWLLMRVAGQHDRSTTIDELIHALTELRDVREQKS